jgi:hypothetical protein
MSYRIILTHRQYVNLPKTGKLLILNNCAELIPTAGHCVMLDTPTELNVMMQRFIKKWNTDTPLATTLI